MTIILDRVDASDIDALWPGLYPHFAAATLAVETELTPELIRAEAAAGRRTIWVVVDDTGEAFLATLSTFVMTSNRGRRVAVIEACAGQLVDRWLPVFLAQLEQQAKNHGCHSVVFSGRLGWEPKTVPLGYRRLMVTMTKEL